MVSWQLKIKLSFLHLTFLNTENISICLIEKV